MSVAILSESHPIAAARPNPPEFAALWHAPPPDFPSRPVPLHTGRRHGAAMFGARFADLDLLDFADDAR